jgi:ketosteroid isomerase-like protein
MSIHDEVEAVDSAFEKAVANRDTAGIVSLYAPDAYLLPPNAPMAKGAVAIGAVMDAYFAAGAESLDLGTETLEDRGDLVIEVGHYSLRVAPPRAEPFSDEGKYLQVFKRQADGNLCIAYDCFNSNQPMG